ncbi:hypothetical protein CK203_042826 [Vitis vinifera]|uniref:Retrotransposon gag domain-containing protein n=1 Tax=Vitis vinifera TaxID=29760 RepID=A0A438HQL9_VITVI|nr:hypothetical protein CK203_042826 [Vitis vinifera]
MGQQAQQVPPLDGAQYDHTVPPPPPPSQSAPQAMPFTLHSQTEVAPPPATVPTPTSEDPHARMDRLEQGLRQLRTSDRAITWEGFDGVPVASLPAKFRMPDIERYTGIGCPRLHLRLYSTVMRLMDWTSLKMITLFPTIFEWGGPSVDVSRRELEALRQRAEESVSSFISRWRGKIAEIIDRPSERDQIQMVLRSLQPRIARHVVGAPFTDFGSLVMALYDVEDGPRPVDVSAIGSSSQRPPRRHQPASSSANLCTFCFEDAETVFTDRHAVEPGSSEAYRGWVIDYSHPRPPPQPIPPQFRMDLHCALPSGAGTQTDRCTALRHAIQDLIDQGLVHLGQPSVTTNPLPAHTTHAVPPPADGIHFLEF